MDRDGASASIGATAIGKYQIFASLGRGGMADVFLAVARGPMGFNKLTVIKRLRSDHAADPSFASMLLEEARLAARLSHPNVVHTYEVGEENGVYFIAMEYLEGQPLVRVARTSERSLDRLTAPFAARIIADALAGLHYAHELRDYDGSSLQIIHRDVSPHNIFVTYDGVVKIMDFGIAKAASSATQTEVGVLKGKLAYMAPEQVMSEPVDRRADIFAMGIVLWELLTGDRLFNASVAAATMHKLITQPIPKVSERVPGIDPKLDALVARALEKKPADRFQTAQEMRNALEDYIAASGTSPRQDEIGRRVSELFEDTRQNVKRQIQVHMAQVSAATSTGELMMLNADALKRVAAEPTPSGQNLISLSPHDRSGSGQSVEGRSGSGSSEVIAAGSPSLAGDAAPTRTKRGATVLAVLLLVLVLFGVGFARLRSPGEAPLVGTGVPAGPAVGVAPGAPAPPPSAAPPAEPLAASSSPPGATVSPPVPVPAVTAPEPQAPPPSAPRHDRPAPHGAVAAAPAPKPAPAAPPPAPAPSPEVAVGTGYLTLDTYPWTRVSENGRLLGTTPLVHVALSAGTHVLTLENPEQGVKQQYPVTLKADEAVSRRLGLK